MPRCLSWESRAAGPRCHNRSLSRAVTPRNNTTPLELFPLGFRWGAKLPSKLGAQWRIPPTLRAPRFQRPSERMYSTWSGAWAEVPPPLSHLSLFSLSVEGKESCEQLPLRAPRGSGGFSCWSESPKPVYPLVHHRSVWAWELYNSKSLPLEISFLLLSYHVSSPLCIVLLATCQFLVFNVEFNLTRGAFLFSEDSNRTLLPSYHSSRQFPPRKPPHSPIMIPKECSYLFAIGTIFAFLDAWNIGKPSSPSSLVVPRNRRLTTTRCQRCRQLVGQLGGR